jgi:threonyl-tRNA synthetase
MEKIKITFPDKSVKEFDKGVTVFDVASSISNRLASDALVGKLNGKYIDMSAKIEEDGELEILTFRDDEGKMTYWHSSSHLMAHAIQTLFPEAKFGVGPPIENGFYYDFDIETKLTEDDLTKIENKMLEIAKEKNVFSRSELSKDEAIKLFEEKGDPYKLEILSELDENEETISIYNEGEFTDLCTDLMFLM